MKSKWIWLSVLGACAVVIALVAFVTSGGAQPMHMTGGMAAGAPGGMMCDPNVCKANLAKLDEVAKALDAAKKAADGGDAKAAAASIDKASALLKEAQESMKKMLASASPSAVVNVRCPILGGAIDPTKVPADLVREYKGQKVGFCCGGCPQAWDKLSDADKDKKLAVAMKPAETPK